MKIEKRPWKPQDLLDDLQSIIDEEPDCYLNTMRSTLCMARDYLKEFFSSPPNDPLTLEELREMDGEPVWTAALDYGASRWAFVSADCEVVRYFTTRHGVACDVIGRHFRTYGKTWLAYRRKPEEGAM